MSEPIVVPGGLLEDSGWKLDERTSRPRRGILDYTRIIKFDHKLTREELTAVSHHCQENQPGYCNWSCHQTAPGVVCLTSTCDSSD